MYRWASCSTWNGYPDSRLGSTWNEGHAVQKRGEALWARAASEHSKTSEPGEREIRLGSIWARPRRPATRAPVRERMPAHPRTRGLLPE